MPTRSRRRQDRARQALSSAPSIQAFFDILNRDVAVVPVGDDSYFFNAHIPSHAALQRALRAIAEELVTAGATGKPPAVDWRAIIEAAVPTVPRPTLSDEKAIAATLPVVARVAYWDQSFAASKAALQLEALKAIALVVVEHYFIGDGFRAYQILGRCRECSRFFPQVHDQRVYCESERCRAQAARRLSRERTKSWRRRQGG